MGGTIPREVLWPEGLFFGAAGEPQRYTLFLSVINKYLEHAG